VDAFVDLHYTRFFPYPVQTAYAWCTDYQDDDPARAGHVIIQRRPVLERTQDKVVMEGEVEMLGQAGRGKVEVRLFPPDRWEAHVIDGRGRGTVYYYSLEPAPGGSRLRIRFRFKVRRLKGWIRLTLAKPLIRRRVATMWDHFAASMAREIPSNPPGPNP